MSLRLPPVRAAASDIPAPSVNTWCLEPALARSTSRACRRCSTRPATAHAGVATPRPAPIRNQAAGQERPLNTGAQHEQDPAQHPPVRQPTPRHATIRGPFWPAKPRWGTGPGSHRPQAAADRRAKQACTGRPSEDRCVPNLLLQGIGLLGLSVQRVMGGEGRDWRPGACSLPTRTTTQPASSGAKQPANAGDHEQAPAVDTHELGRTDKRTPSQPGWMGGRLFYWPVRVRDGGTRSRRGHGGG